MAGTVGAIFYCGLQLGAAVGIAAVTSIEATVNKRASGDAPGYHGLRAAYWFIFAADAALLVATAIFYRAEVRTTDAGGDHVGPAKWGEARPSELAGGSEMTHDISAHQRGDVGEKC